MAPSATTVAVISITTSSGPACLPTAAEPREATLVRPSTVISAASMRSRMRFPKRPPRVLAAVGHGSALNGGKLEVCSSANQDNPLMPGVGCGGYPILGIDVWEHAYYLNYQNRRPDYISAFFNVVDWNAVSERFSAAQ